MATINATSGYLATIGDNTSIYNINLTEITIDGSTTYSVLMTRNPASTLLVPRLNSSHDLVVYVSVLCGILGFVLLLAILGWISDQTAQFGDPVGEKLCKIYRKASRHDNSLPFVVFPKTQISDDPDMPRWMHEIHGAPHGAENEAYEIVDQTLEAQHQAAEHLGQIREEISDEFSDNEYDDVGSESPPPRPVKPSQVAAYERKSKKEKKQQAEDNEYATHIPSGSNGHRRINSNPQSEVRYFQDPESRSSVKPEEEYGGSLYSNIETPPTVPPRI